MGIDRDIESRESGNMKFIKGDVVAGLLLPDDFFDTVLVLAVIEHIEPEKANNFLMEAKRILKKGGRLIITSPTPSSKPILEFLVFKLKIANKEAVADHKHYYALNEMRNLLKNAGFHEIESGYFEFFLNAFYIFKK